MQISFFPTLGSRTSVPVEANPDRQGEGARAAFTARLSAHDYEQTVNTGARIEVWTNAPANGRPAGEWGAVAFNKVDVPLAQDVGEAAKLSLEANKPLSPVDAKLPLEQEHIFQAALVLPNTPGHDFWFTYRLVFPSGICWLGSDRNNGVLKLEAGSAFFEEGGSWETHEGTRRSKLDAESEQLEEEYSVIGRLNTNEWEWSGWATDGSRVWALKDNSFELAQEARLVYLIPTAPKGSFVLPQTHVLRAISWDSPFSITSQGHVVLRSCRQGAGIEHRVHDFNSENDINLLQNEVTSSCSAPHIFHANDTTTILFTPNYDSDSSVTIYAMPLTTTPLCTVSVPITTLDSFAKQSSLLSLFIPETRSTLFVDRSEYSGALAFKFGASGAHVVVSAVYDLTDSSMPYSSWQFSLPTCSIPAERISESIILENPLPTPPASPPSKPSRTVSFVLPLENDAESGVLERKKDDAPSTPSPSQSGAAAAGPTRRLLRSDSAFERFQTASGGEKIKLVMINVLKLLTRFVGVAVIRFILLAFRLITGGGAKQSEAVTGQADLDPGEVDTTEEGHEGTAAVGSPEESEAVAHSGVEKNEVGTPPIHNRRALSTETVDSDDLGPVRSNPRPRLSTAPALRWMLPAGVATPIRLLVCSDVEPEAISKHLSIELDGELSEVTTLVAHSMEDKATTSVIEVARTHGAAATLLIKLRA